jgi:putative transposase
MRKRHSAAFKAQVVQEVLKEEKTIAQIASEYGVHPTQISTWKAAALKGLPSLFEREKADADQRAQKEAQERQLQELYAQIGRLTTQVAWLKKNLASNLRREERLALLEREGSELPLSVQADLLSLSRASLYYQPAAPAAQRSPPSTGSTRFTRSAPSTARGASPPR